MEDKVKIDNSERDSDDEVVINRERMGNFSVVELEMIAEMTLEQKIAYIKEKEREEREFKLKCEQIKSQERVAMERARIEGTDSMREDINNCSDDMERFARKIKACIPRMPDDDMTAIPAWFSIVENIFAMYEVPDGLRGKLLIPFISGQIKNVLVRLNVEQLQNYQILKETILEEYRLAPAAYLKNFMECRKRDGETWTQFAGKLRDILGYYWKACKVSTVEEALELCVADEFKRKLSPSAREYVILKEAGKIMSAIELAGLVNKYEEARGQGTQVASNNYEKKIDRRWGNFVRSPEKFKKENSREVERKRGDEMEIICNYCKRVGHIKRNCPRLLNLAKSKSVNRVEVSGANSSKDKGENDTSSDGRSTRDEKMNSSHHVARVDMEIGNRENKLVKSLHKVGIKVDKVGQAIVDSGTQITVVHKDLVDENIRKSEGKIKLVGAFGETIEAELMTLPMSIAGASEDASIDMLCAVTEELRGEFKCLIHPEDLENLRQAKLEMGYCIMEEEEIEDKQGVLDDHAIEKESDDEESDREWMVTEVVALEEEEESTEAKRFAALQRQDETLKEAWKQAEDRTHAMTVCDGLLYHYDDINGMKVKQLVLPVERRNKVLEVAHDSRWGGHLGSKKTTQRIKLNFYWPKMTADIQRYCQSCHMCQTRSRPRRTDKTPITPIVRPEVAFDVVNMDIISVDPPSARGHKYILCLVDLNTRWPEAICLRSLNARATCEALLSVFSRTGLPKLITSDQGTNFTAKLTELMTDMFNVHVRFSTPEHPNSNGAVERWNGTLKNMIAQVVREHSRDWDKMLPFLLWAYREVPNETTGVSPFELLYGRIPNGPLANLADEWSGELILPLDLDDPNVDFLGKVRERILEVNRLAKETAVENQRYYASHYNLRSKHKTFEIGDQVLVLKRNPANKLDTKWEGPAVVLEKRRENSYWIRMEEGKKRWVHADNLRKYFGRVSAVGIVFEDDEDFGNIQWAPVNVETQQLYKFGLDHLEDDRRRAIRDVLDRYADVFSHKPGKTKLVEHTIELMPGFVPNKPHPYRIPLAFREEVRKQIKELLDSGLIVPVQSNFAHPIVCSIKKDGSLRLCVDYRNLNAGTIADAFPMQNPTELMYKIAGARFITVLDMVRGYWQVPMQEESIRYTAFVTEDGMFAWKVLPFGLKNSAATYQRLMNLVLASHSGYASAYIDDVAIYSNTWSKHLEHVEAVLGTLRKEGLKVNPKKCEFAKPQVRYLGHIIGSGQHTVSEESVAPIREYQRPVTKKQLRKFLGFCGYYRDYIKNFAQISIPLTDMTGKRRPNQVQWDEDTEKAFMELKEKLCEIPRLYAPKWGQEYVLFTDASDRAVGACLAQYDDNGKELPIAFASKKLSPVQQKWATVEKEAYAIVWALAKFDTWVYGNKVKIITDHNPLTYLTAASPKGAKLTRWALAIQRYHLTIVHRKGQRHINADFLSRISEDKN